MLGVFRFARIGLLALVGGAAMVSGITVSACGGDDQATSGSSGPAGGSGGTVGSGGAGGAGGESIGVGGGGDCAGGRACEDGNICVGGECCAPELACEDSCCAASEVCSFQSCVAPGDTCVDSDDCQQDEYCEYALGEPMGQGGGGGMCAGGAELPTGKCLPEPPICGPDEDPGEPPSCLEPCEHVPPAPSFTPELKYSWGMELTAPYATDVMMSPVVIQLDDDDCDGTVDERDIPEIVFSTFSNGSYEENGVLHAITVEGGTLVEEWSLSGIVNPTKQIAAGNIDGAPGNEIVACGADGTVVAVDAAGNPLWTTSTSHACVMPSVADLDQDGDVEVVVEGGILDGATGQLEHAYSAPIAGGIVVSDITGDGQLEIVTGSQAYDAQGTLLVDTGMANTSSFPDDSDWKAPWPAVADLDGDGAAEVIVVHNLAHELSIWRYDTTQPNDYSIVRQPVDINGDLDPAACGTSWGATHGGGPPTVADFNGDGTPDVALAGGVGYAVFDGAELMDPNVAGGDTFLWLESTTDCSSASTGSTVFDFNGDGVAEVVYSDELMLRVYEGPTGTVLWETCNTTATLIENPVVADVDNDGHADIVAVSNAYAKTCDDGTTTKQAGIRVFSDTAWVRTRRVWNEHAYHITNVNEDGSIPQVENVNYTQPSLNNFRLNKQPGGEFSAPDAVVTAAPICAGPYALAATVQNVGEAALPAGVAVGFYEGSPPNGTLIGSEVTTRVLYPLDSETLELPAPNAPAAGYESIYAVVDDGGDPHPEWTECRPDNNTSPPVSGECVAPR